MAQGAVTAAAGSGPAARSSCWRPEGGIRSAGALPRSHPPSQASPPSAWPQRLVNGIKTLALPWG